MALQAAERSTTSRARRGAPPASARAYTKLSRPDEALRHYRHRPATVRRVRRYHAGQAHTHLGLGAILEQRGDHRTALRHAREALDLLRLAGNRPGQANA